MATRYEMSWDSGRGRWVKMYKGNRYTIACSVLGVPATKEGSSTAANAWWRKRRAEIDATPITDPLAGRALQIRRDLLQAASLDGEEGEFVDRLKREVKAIEGGSSVPDVFPVLPGDNYERAQWAERLGAVHKHKKWTGKELPPDDKTLGKQIDAFLNGIIARQAAGETTVGSYKNTLTWLTRLKEFFGESAGVEILDENGLDRYANHLLGLVGAKNRGEKGLSRAVAKECLAVTKRFVRHLWERRLVELPRNLDRLDIRREVHSIQTIEPEMVRFMIAESHGQLKLHLLLMVNCGYGPTDIATLKDAEVDWESGRIRRKRSKTAAHDNVPVVDYKLWQPTFELLKQYRSGQELALLTPHTGTPWLSSEVLPDGKYSVKNSIASNYWHLRQKLKARGIVPPPMKLFRKTGASLIESHPTLGRYASHYLGHSPKTIAERHYVAPSRENFDELLNWLGKKLGIIS